MKLRRRWASPSSWWKTSGTHFPRSVSSTASVPISYKTFFWKSTQVSNWPSYWVRKYWMVLEPGGVFLAVPKSFDCLIYVDHVAVYIWYSSNCSNCSNCLYIAHISQSRNSRWAKETFSKQPLIIVIYRGKPNIDVRPWFFDLQLTSDTSPTNW